MLDCFKKADEVLYQAVKGISDLINIRGLINLDFADVKAIMANAGSALMGIGRASGEDRAAKAAQQAIESPLIEVSIDGAKGVLFNVTGGYDMSMSEIQEAAEIITAAVAPDANIIFGATLKPEIDDELIITVIATGFDSEYFHEQTPAMPPSFGAMTTPAVATSVADDVSDDDMKNVDMNLDNDQTAHVASSFNDEEPTGNIWHQVDEDESDTPAFLRRRKK